MVVPRATEDTAVSLTVMRPLRPESRRRVQETLTLSRAEGITVAIAKGEPRALVLVDGESATGLPAVDLQRIGRLQKQDVVLPRSDHSLKCWFNRGHRAGVVKARLELYL